MDFSSNLHGDLALKNGRTFGEFSVVSFSQETKHEKSWKNSGKLRSKIRGKDLNNSGTFCSAPFLT